MSENSSKKPTTKTDKVKSKLNWRRLIGLPLWVLVSFGLAQVVFVAIVLILQAVGVSLDAANPAVVGAVSAAGVYMLMLVIAVGVPWWLRGRVTNRRELGLQRLPGWLDIGLAPATFVVYILTSGLLVLLTTYLLPGFDPVQAQEIGFEDLTHRYELILAFVTLVIAAPVAEEILFRGYLYGKLRRTTPIWLTGLVVSVLFAALHLPGTGGPQWNVAIDVFVLSVFLCGLREVTGSIWAGILLHAIKNGLAFYILFINPSIMGLGG